MMFSSFFLMTSTPKIVIQNTFLFLDDDLIILIPWAVVTSAPPPPPLRRTPHIPLLTTLLDLPRGLSVVALHYLNLWLAKLLMYQRIIVPHVNDPIQVVFAARFIWRRHSNTTTLRFLWKTCDLFFLEITWLCVPLWFRYQVWIHRNASPPCVINIKIFFHVWNLVKFKGQKYH